MKELSNINVDAAALADAAANLKNAITSIDATKAMLKQKYQQLGNGWNDKKYIELGNIVHMCLAALNNIEQNLLKGKKYVILLSRHLQEYESINLGSESNMSFVSQILQTPSEASYNLGSDSGRDNPLDNTNEVLVKLNEFGVQSIESVNSWIKSINPNPSNDPRRKVNCGKCAAAVYKRLNGDNNAVAGLGTYSIEEMNEITGRTQTAMTPEEIENYLITQGAGSHVVVGVDRSSGAGHWFNAYYDGYHVYTIEGQGGLINRWPPDYGNVVYWDASI